MWYLQVKLNYLEIADLEIRQYINLFYDTIKRPYTPIFINQYTNEIEFLIKSYENGEVSNKIIKNYINNAIINYKLLFAKRRSILFKK